MKLKVEQLHACNVLFLITCYIKVVFYLERCNQILEHNTFCKSTHVFLRKGEDFMEISDSQLQN